MGFVAHRDRFTLGVEAMGSTVIDHAFEWGYVNGEVLAAAHYRIADSLLVGLGVGPGLSQGLGTPDLRALAQIAWAPQRAHEPVVDTDTDGDGVLDRDDQ